MSLTGKLTSVLTAAGIVGICATCITGEGAQVIAQVREELYDTARYYIIKEYEGKVALFEEGATEPSAVYSTTIGMINPADVALLKDGIRLRGMAEVARLLEDLDVE